MVVKAWSCREESRSLRKLMMIEIGEPTAAAAWMKPAKVPYCRSLMDDVVKIWDLSRHSSAVIFIFQLITINF